MATKNMKIKSTVTINMGLYMDIRPEVEIDTENYDEAKRLVQELHANFYGLLNGVPKGEYDDINADIETKKQLKQTDWQMQDLFDKVRAGKPIPIIVWQKLTPSDQGILHKAQLQYAQEQRIKKDDKTIQDTR